MSSEKRESRIPSYRRHKPSGQAVVTLNGRDIYLGKWNTRASRAEYERLIGEWLAAGRSLQSGGLDEGPTVAEVALRFWKFAKTYYRKDGRPTGELPEIKSVLRLLRQRGPTASCPRSRSGAGEPSVTSGGARPCPTATDRVQTGSGGRNESPESDTTRTATVDAGLSGEGPLTPRPEDCRGEVWGGVTAGTARKSLP